MPTDPKRRGELRIADLGVLMGAKDLGTQIPQSIDLNAE